MVRVGSGYEASLASQPYFSEYAHARAKVGGRREVSGRPGTPRGAHLPGFRGSSSRF